MGIKNINQNLKEIEQKVYHCLESASKYSYDQSIDETDYSKEFLYFELFYALGNYERAIKTLEIKSNIKERYESVYQLALETLKLEENTYFDRLDVFGKEYFSDKRYDDQINKFKQSMNFSSLEDISVDDRPMLENNAYALFKIRDELSLLNQNNSLFTCFFEKTNKLDHYLAFEENISSIHQENKWLWSVFNEIIEANRFALLVPNSISWWYDLEPISIESLELELSKSFEKSDEKSKVYEMLLKMTGQFDKLSQSTNDTIEWIVDNHKESFSHLLGIVKTPSPAFQTWSETAPKPTQSDHEINKEVFPRIPGINQSIIEDLIELVQFSDTVDDEQRRNILATAYLIIGKNKEALDLLSDDKK